MKTKPNLFSYENFKSYLKDSYDFLKKNQKGFSYRKFSLAAGFTSPNYLKLVMEGKRKLTRESIPKFSKALKHTKNESVFFENLVLMNQCENDKDKASYFEKISKNKQFKSVRNLEREKFEFYSQWYFAAIYELIGTRGFKSDAGWIGDHLLPQVPKEKINYALNQLQLLGLIKKNKNGEFEKLSPMLSSGAETKSIAVKSFHRSMIGLAQDALDNYSSQERDISAVMVAVPQVLLPEIKQVIAQFRKKLLLTLESFKEKDIPDQLYQVNLQFFPLSKKGQS